MSGAGSGRTPVVTEVRGRFAVTPEALWPLVADTEHLNHAIGLPPARFTPAEIDGKPARRAAMYWHGLRLASWIEHPFTWEAPHHYSVRRDYDSGPFRRFDGGVELIGVDGGTEVRSWAEITPRHWLGAALARWVVGPRGTESVLVQCRVFEQYLKGQAPTAFPQLVPRGGLHLARLDALSQELIAAGNERLLVERLRQFLAEAPDVDVGHIRPFELADRWDADRREVLALCLHATVVGLLELSWHVLCPNCRISKVEYRTLEALREDAHCDTCRIRFGVDFDRLVEARFAVAPAVRPVSSDVYCIGGPLNTPHVLAQTTVAPGAAASLRLPSRVGRFRLRPLAGQSALLLLRDAADTSPFFVLSEDRITPAEAALDPACEWLTLENRQASESVVVLETDSWTDAAATGAIIGTVPEFRKLFSAEVLAPGLEVRIQRLGFLFTDLAGSTALYERVGDAAAFRLVHEHFAILTEVVEGHRGAVVKTVGDAVMAVFPTGADAIEAAVLIQRDIRALDGRGAVDPRRLVRIGVHEGPCVAVTLNGRLDYFGTTVNTAARVEHACHGGEVAASAVLYEQPEVAERLRGLPVTAEPFTAELRGLSAQARLYRIHVQWEA